MSETTPEAGTVSYTYTTNDQIATTTNANSKITTVSYNNRNLVTGINYSDSTPSVSYSYDEYGARTAMTDNESFGYICWLDYRGPTKQDLIDSEEYQRGKRNIKSKPAGIKIQVTKQQNLQGEKLKFPDGGETDEEFWGHGIGALYTLVDSNCNTISDWMLEEKISIESYKPDGAKNIAIHQTDGPLEEVDGKFADAIGLLLGSRAEYLILATQIPLFERTLKQELWAVGPQGERILVAINKFTSTNYGESAAFGSKTPRCK